MANEQKLSISLTYENGQLKKVFQPGTVQLPQATQGVVEQTVSVTTADTAVTFTGNTTPGMLIMQNLEATTTGITAKLGPQSSTGGIVPMVQLEPKGIAVLSNFGSTATLRHQTTGGSVSVHLTLFEA